MLFTLGAFIVSLLSRNVLQLFSYKQIGSFLLGAVNGESKTHYFEDQLQVCQFSRPKKNSNGSFVAHISMRIINGTIWGHGFVESPIHPLCGRWHLCNDPSMDAKLDLRVKVGEHEWNDLIQHYPRNEPDAIKNLRAFSVHKDLTGIEPRTDSGAFVSMPGWSGNCSLAFESELGDANTSTLCSLYTYGATDVKAIANHVGYHLELGINKYILYNHEGSAFWAGVLKNNPALRVATAAGRFSIVPATSSPYGHYYWQSMLNNDCILRNVGSSETVLVMDVDEYLVTEASTGGWVGIEKCARWRGGIALFKRFLQLHENNDQNGNQREPPLCQSNIRGRHTTRNPKAAVNPKAVIHFHVHDGVSRLGIRSKEPTSQKCAFILHAYNLLSMRTTTNKFFQSGVKKKKRESGKLVDTWKWGCRMLREMRRMDLRSRNLKADSHHSPLSSNMPQQSL